jgi:hypothetical protein
VQIRYEFEKKFAIPIFIRPEKSVNFSQNIPAQQIFHYSPKLVPLVFEAKFYFSYEQKGVVKALFVIQPILIVCLHLVS